VGATRVGIGDPIGMK